MWVSHHSNICSELIIHIEEHSERTEHHGMAEQFPLNISNPLKPTASTTSLMPRPLPIALEIQDFKISPVRVTTSPIETP